MSQQDELRKREQEWDKLKALGLHPEIRSLEIYVTAVALGLQTAIETLLDYPVRLPDLETIRKVHFQMFGRVHPWAGEFRSSGQHVNVGTRFRGADPEQIVYELELAKLQTDKLSKTGNHLEAVAFFHLRLERIHPFLDGNGRVGRALLQSQLAAEFGFRMSLVFKKSEYTAALHAGERNLLGPLMQCIGSCHSIRVFINHFIGFLRIQITCRAKGSMWVCKNREDNTYAIGNPQLMAHKPMRINVQNWNLDLR